MEKGSKTMDKQLEEIPDPDNDICNICISNQSNIVLETCGHTSLCQECISRIVKKRRDQDGNPTAKLKCPYCQGKVQRVLKLKRHLFKQPEVKENVEEEEELNEFYGDTTDKGEDYWYVVERVWGDYNDLKDMTPKSETENDQANPEEEGGDNNA